MSLIACAPYSVVKQAAVNPLADGKGKLKLQGIDFSQMTLKGYPESDVLARQASASEFRSYDTDKRKLDANYRLEVSKQLARLIGEGDDGYTVVVTALNLNPGLDLGNEKPEAGVAASTNAHFAVDLCNKDKTVLDRFVVEVGMAQTAAEPQASQRIRALGTKLGDAVASYLKTRAGL